MNFLFQKIVITRGSRQKAVIEPYRINLFDDQSFELITFVIQRFGIQLGGIGGQKGNMIQIGSVFDEFSKAKIVDRNASVVESIFGKKKKIQGLIPELLKKRFQGFKIIVRVFSQAQENQVLLDYRKKVQVPQRTQGIGQLQQQRFFLILIRVNN